MSWRVMAISRGKERQQCRQRRICVQGDPVHLKLRLWAAHWPACLRTSAVPARAAVGARTRL